MYIGMNVAGVGDGVRAATTLEPFGKAYLAWHSVHTLDMCHHFKFDKGIPGYLAG
jgi:hypothetical protein